MLLISRPCINNPCKSNFQLNPIDLSTSSLLQFANNRRRKRARVRFNYGIWGCLGVWLLSRNAGGDDIFVHRSSLVDGGILVQGSPVQFEVTWNAQKGQGHEGHNVDMQMNLLVFLWPKYIEKSSTS